MLRLLYGRGKVFDEICAAAQKGVNKQILIVPQHYSHEAERKLCESGGDSISQFCEVLTMKRLANRVFGEYGGLADKVLDDGGRLLLMCLASRSVSSSLKEFAGHIRKPEFLEGLIRLIDEFKTYGVAADDLAQAAAEKSSSLGSKISDLALIYSAYDALLGQGGIDPADILSRLADMLERYDYAAGKTVYIEGFTEFTPQETRVVEALLRKADSLTACFDIDPSLDSEGAADQLQDGAFYGCLKSIERLRRIAARYGQTVSTPNPEDNSESTEIRDSGILFLRKNLLRSEVEVYKGQCKEVSLHTAENKWNECEQAASMILHLCKEESYRFRDIIVAVPDYSAYSGIIEAVFESWEIPLFSDRMDDIMKKPVMAAVEAALDVMLGGFEYRDMFRYLKTGLPGLTFDQCCKLENYVLAWNIKGRLWTSGNDWTMNPMGFSDDSGDETERLLKELNELRTAVIKPFIRFLQRVPVGKELPAAEVIAALYDFIVEVGIDRMISLRREEYIKRGELKAAEEYAQLWGLICDALDTCFNVLKDTRMDFQEFAGMFRLLLGSMEVGTIPVSIDCVAAGDAGRMRHRNAKCVILLGACNGSFPPPIVRNSLLTDENRIELLDLGIALEPPSSQLAYRELEAAFSILTLPEKRLIISWPQSDQGAQRTPSYLVDKIRRMFWLSVNPPVGDERLTYAARPCLELALRSAGQSNGGMLSQAAFRCYAGKEEYRAVVDAAAETARSERSRLSAESVRKLYGDKIRLTASRADRLRSCKYAYFMQYGLRAKPRFKAGFDALESGSFLHFVLEGTMKAVMDHGGFKVVSLDEVKRIADDLANTYSIDVLGGMADKSARVRFLFRRLKRTAARVVENVAEELRLSDFKPLSFELEFGGKGDVPAVSAGEGDESVELMGVVDRVDGWEKDGKLYIRVVDYKSGYKKFDLSDIWHGLSLQMLIYLFALEQRGEEIYGRETVGAGVLYIPVKDAVYSGSRGISADKIREKTDEALRRSGLVLKVPDVVEAMESGKPKRFIPVSFARGSDNYSDSASLANLEQLGKLKLHIDMLLKQMGRALHEGRAEADPYYRDLRTSACTFCEYAQACRFDQTNGTDKMRYLYKVKPKEFWERLEAEENAH